MFDFLTRVFSNRGKSSERPFAFLEDPAERTLFDERVGLDLPGLVARLPESLRPGSFTDFVVARRREGEPLSVALLRRTDDAAVRVCGNPLNVGLTFDRTSGALLEVHPRGIGLGLK